MITIRPITPADRPLLIAGFERLSPESRYRRFFAPVARLTNQQLDYLTKVDQHDHVALIAVDEDSGDAVGVARFVRTGPGVAEPAVVVADDRQGEGVGRALLDRLVKRAGEVGVVRFVAPVLAENEPAKRALSRLGATTAEYHGREVDLTVELPAAVAAESTLRRLLRAVAAGTIDPAMVFWHRLRPLPGVPHAALGNVIVADEAEPAAETAAGLAAATRASLVLVAAGRPLIDDADELAARLERRAASLRVGVREVQTVSRLGDLGVILLDEAIIRGARLIVVGDPSEDDGSGGRLLGRPWDHVSHHAPCDVLIARQRVHSAPVFAR